MMRYNWSAIEVEQLNPLLSRQVIHTEQMTIAQLWLGKGSLVPLHAHVNQQTTMVKSALLWGNKGRRKTVLNYGVIE